MTHDADHRAPAARRHPAAGGPVAARRVALRVVGAALVVAATLSGCTSTPSGPTPSVGSSVPADGPTAPPTAAALPDVPVRSSALEAAVVPEAVPPVSLAIAALGIVLPVDPVGVQADGQMEIPPLAERAGWYRFGAGPADALGTAVIAAHVDSVASAGLGPFARLPDAAVGDVVDVSLADGTVRQYAVTAVERRDKTQVVWSDVFVRDGAHRLVLVTCGGVFQPDAGRYADNVIVTAEPVGGP